MTWAISGDILRPVDIVYPLSENPALGPRHLKYCPLLHQNECPLMGQFPKRPAPLRGYLPLREPLVSHVEVDCGKILFGFQT